MKKRIILLILLLAAAFLAAVPQAGAASSDKALTLMVYICGSNLESEAGAATEDIREMLNAGVDTDRVNVLLMTGGSQYWATNQDPAYLLISRLNGRNIETERVESARSMGDPETLTRFISYGVKNHPAQNYALILWDHGGGPLLGVCVDELEQGDALGLDELTRALDAAPLPKKLSWIGFDACLMGSAEVALAMSPYAEYMIASQETEPGTGWDYRFLRGIEADANGAATGKRIVDAYFEGMTKNGITLSCVDLSKAEQLSAALSDYFGPISRDMGADVFGRLSKLRFSSSSFGKVTRRVSTSSYDLVDLNDLLSRCDGLGNFSALGRLRATLKSMVVYSRSKGIEAGGLSVYHPMHNKAVYAVKWRKDYAGLSFGSGYKQYVTAFGDMLVGRQLADWSQIRLKDDGFGSGSENRFSVKLSKNQQDCFSSAQLVMLAMMDATVNGSTNIQLTEGGVSQDKYSLIYFPVSAGDVALGEDGVLSASFTGTSLYVVDEKGEPVAGPVGYELSDDGKYLYIFAYYMDKSGREDALAPAKVLYVCRVDEKKREATVMDTYVYDRVMNVYSRRLGFSEENYTDLWIDRMALKMPKTSGLLPGLDQWESSGSWDIELKLPLKWKLRFIDEQLSGMPLYAAMQITDTQQNTFCTPLTRVENPNLYAIDVKPRKQTGPDFELTLYAVQDASKLNPGLSIGAELKNTSNETLTYYFESLVFNGTRSVSEGYDSNMYFGNVAPGATVYDTCRIDQTDLTGLGSLNRMEFTLRSLSNGYANHSEGRYSCSFSGCDVSSLAAKETAPLAQQSGDGLAWQLVSLEKNAQGGLTGLLHVRNDRDQSIFLSGNIVVNDCVQTADKVYVRAQPHTDLYVPFTISNRAVTTDLLDVAGNNSYYVLGLDRLLEQYGVKQVEKLKFCLSQARSDETVQFTLKKPLPFATAEEVARAQAEAAPQTPRLLLDGEVSVNVDRIMVADNGVAARITLRNNSKRDIELNIDNKTINGHYAFSMFPDTYYLGAGASSTACIVFRAYSDDVKNVRNVESLGMTFRYEGYTTDQAAVRFKKPTTMGAYRGSYLSWSDFTTEPTRYNRPTGVGIEPQAAAVADSLISLEMSFSNRDYSSYSDKITMKFHIENQSQDKLEYRLERFILNGARYLGDGVSAYTTGVEAGKSYDCKDDLEMIGLTNLNEISSISFTLTVERNGDYRNKEYYPVTFDLFGCDISGISPKSGAPIAETKRSGVVWRLYSLEVNKEGRLVGLMSIANESDEALDGKYTSVVVEGVHAGGSYVNADVPAGTERYSELTFVNGVSLDYPIKAKNANLPEPYVSQALQQMGITSVSNITLLVDVNNLHGTIERTVPLKLSKPLRLPAAASKASLDKGAALLKGDVSVTLTNLLAADNGFQLTLVVRNETAVPSLLKVFAPSVGGRTLTEDDSFCVPPRTVRVINVGYACDKVMSPGDAYRDIQLAFFLDGEMYEGASIQLGKSVPFGNVAEFPYSKLTVKAAKARTTPAVYEKVTLPNPADVRSALLEAPLTKKQTGNFDYGYATVCSRGTMKLKDDSGEETEHPRLTPLTRVPLSLKNGRLLANFSGMSLQYKDWDWVCTEEIPLSANTARLQLDAVIFTTDDPLEGDLPEAGLSALDHGIQAHYEWTLKYGKKLEVTEAKCRMRDIATGKTVDPKKVTLDRIQNIYTERTIRVTDDPALSPLRQVKWGTSGPLPMRMNPVEALSGDLCVLFEIHYKDGSVDWIEDDYR